MKKAALRYVYPRDCGEKLLFSHGLVLLGKHVTTLNFECYHWEHFRSGGHLSLREPGDSDSDSSDEENRVCDLTLKFDSSAGWYVYWVDMVCDKADARILAQFATFEGAEIFARIVYNRENGQGLFKGEERIPLDVRYESAADFKLPRADNGESCGTYLVIVGGGAPGTVYVHSLNPCDDWDQVGKTPLNVKPPAAKKTKCVAREEPARKKKKIK